MAVTFVRSHVAEFVKAAGTTDAYALTSLVPAGNLLVMTLVHDNAAVVANSVVSSISKPAGETASWVFLGRAQHPTSTSAGAFANGEMWAIKTTVDWPNATSLTVTYGASITMKAQNILEFSGAEAVLRSTVGTAYTAVAGGVAMASTSGTTPVVGDLAVGLIFGSNLSAAQSGDNDTTGGAWSSVFGLGSTGGNATTNNFGIGQYKIITTTSHQSFSSPGALTTGNGSIVAILRATPDPVISQAAFRFYEDGTESGSIALAAQNTAPLVNISAGDAVFQLRVRMQETGNGNVPPTDNFQLQFEKNASGTWTNVSPAPGPVMSYDSPRLTNAGATTSRLTGGTGSFAAGEISEGGVVDSLGWAQSGYTELLYSLKLIAADLAPGDTLRFRVLRNGLTTGVTYTQTPTLTAFAGPMPLAGTVAIRSTVPAASLVQDSVVLTPLYPSWSQEFDIKETTVTVPPGYGILVVDLAQFDSGAQVTDLAVNADFPEAVHTSGNYNFWLCAPTPGSVNLWAEYSGGMPYDNAAMVWLVSLNSDGNLPEIYDIDEQYDKTVDVATASKGAVIFVIHSRDGWDFYPEPLPSLVALVPSYIQSSNEGFGFFHALPTPDSGSMAFGVDFSGGWGSTAIGVSLKPAPLAGGGTTHIAAGTIAISSTASGNATVPSVGTTYQVSGTVSGATALTGTATKRTQVTGAVTAVSVSSGSATRVPVTYQASGVKVLTSTVSGTATVVAGAQTYPASGVKVLTSAISGTVSKRTQVSGALAFVSVNSGAAKLTATASGAVVGVSAVSGTLSKTTQAFGTSSAVSSVSGNPNKTTQASGSLSVTTDSTGSATVVSTGTTYQATGSISASSSVSGTVTALKTILAPGTEVRRNLFRNPSPSNSTTHFSSTGSTLSLGVSQYGGLAVSTRTTIGNYRLLDMLTGNTVVAGESYRFQFVFTTTEAMTGIYIYFRPNVTSNTNQVTLWSNGSIASPLSYLQFGTNFTVPAGAGDLTNSGIVIVQSGSTVGSELRVGQVLLERGVSVMSPWFDGDLWDTPQFDFQWVGTPEDSASVALEVGSKIAINSSVYGPPKDAALRAEYGFNEGSGDFIAGEGPDAVTLEGSPPAWYTDGVYGTAFGSATDPDAYFYSSLDAAGLDEFSSTIWLKPHTSIYGGGEIWWGPAALCFTVIDGVASLSYKLRRPTGVTIVVAFDTTIPMFAWSHVAVSVIRPQGAIKLYLNGVLVETKGFSPHSAAGLLYDIEAWLDTVAVDDFRFFEGILTESEVSAYMLQSVGEPPPPLPTSGAIAVTSATDGAVSLQRAAVGVVPSSSSVSGTPTKRSPVAGSVVVLSIASGALTLKTAVSATLPIVSTVSGAPITSAKPVTGTVIAVSAANGAPTTRTQVAGAVASGSAVAGAAPIVSAITGAAGRTTYIGGVISAVTATSGSITNRTQVVGTLPIVSTVAGTAIPPTSINGTVSVVSSSVGIVFASMQVTGAVDIASTANTGFASQNSLIGGTVSTVVGSSGDAIRRAPTAGAVQIVSTVSGVSTKRTPVSGTVPVVSTTTGISKLTGVTSGAITVVSAAAGTSTKTTQAAGTSAIVSEVVGSESLRSAVSSQVNVVSTQTGSVATGSSQNGIVRIYSAVSGAVTATLPIAGSVVITSDVSGEPVKLTSAGGAVGASSAVSGALTKVGPLTSTVGLVSNTSGSIRSLLPTAGTGTIISTGSGAPTKYTQGSGVVTATSTVTGFVVSGNSVVAPSMPIVSSVSGAVTARGTTAGVVPVQVAVTGAPAKRTPVSGAASLTSSVSGAPTKQTQITGTPIQTISGVGGSVLGTLVAGGIVTITSTVIGDTNPPKPVSGAVSVVSTVTGSALRQVPTFGTVSVVSTAQGVPAGTLSATSGPVVVGSGVAGTVALRRVAGGTVAAVSGVLGTVGKVSSVSGTTEITAATFGAATRLVQLAGIVTILSSVVGISSSLETLHVKIAGQEIMLAPGMLFWKKNGVEVPVGIARKTNGIEQPYWTI